ncbi:MAG: ketopantoate reductase family protein [Gammaproteobacteria bacterium]
MSRQKVLVVGAGAIGGVFASYFAKVSDVTIFDVNQAHVDAINANGLKLSGETEAVTQIPAVSDPAALADQQFDGVMISVKGMFTRAAVESLMPHLQGRPVLFTIQNGLGNVEILEELVDWPVMHGITLEGGHFIEPGHVKHLVAGEESWVGPARGDFEEVRWFGELMDESGIKTRTVPDPSGAIWSKFIFNSTLNPVGVLVRGVPEVMYQSDEIYELISDMMEEGTKVAHALGIELLFDPMHFINDLRSGKIPPLKHAGSMSYDVAEGRPTEIEFLTGYMVRKAAEVGVDVPVNKAVYRLVVGTDMGVAIRKASGERRQAAKSV